jgi:hypothetical protein
MIGSGVREAADIQDALLMIIPLVAPKAIACISQDLC